MNRELALSLVEDLKADLPVPSETCPVIDSVIKKLTQRRQYDLLPLMESLRKDNYTLRELGKEWHKMASDLAYQFEHKEEAEV